MHLVTRLEGLEMRRSDKLYRRGHFIGEVRTGAVGEQAGAARAKVYVRAISCQLEGSPKVGRGQGQHIGTKFPRVRKFQVPGRNPVPAATFMHL